MRAKTKVENKINSIRLVGQDWKVLEKHSHEISNLGLCHSDIHEIWLNDACLPEIRRNTLLHEVLHALSYIGQLEMSERQVDVLATLLISMARDNPELVDYFFKELNK